MLESSESSSKWHGSEFIRNTRTSVWHFARVSVADSSVLLSSKEAIRTARVSESRLILIIIGTSLISEICNAPPSNMQERRVLNFAQRRLVRIRQSNCRPYLSLRIMEAATSSTKTFVDLKFIRPKDIACAKNRYKMLFEGDCLKKIVCIA